MRNSGEEGTEGARWGPRLRMGTDAGPRGWREEEGCREQGVPNRRRGPGSSSSGAEDGRVGTLLYVQRTQRSSRGKAGPQEVLPSKKELAF